MAYITKETVNSKKEGLKTINKKYGVKSTFSGANSSKLFLTISSGSIDFIENYIDVDSISINQWMSDSSKTEIRKTQSIQVNHYHLDTNFSGTALGYLEEVKDLMLDGHWDDSDSQSDYFSCAYYISIDIGKWDKPYQFLQS